MISCTESSTYLAFTPIIDFRRRGYLLQIAPRTGITSRIDINGLGAEMTLRDEVLDVRRPGQTFEQELRLEFRFVLDAGVPSGTFELPVSVAAAPI